MQWTWTGPGQLTSTVTGRGSTYQVAVSGMAGNGTLHVTIGADTAFDLSENPNVAAASGEFDYHFEKRFDFGTSKSPLEFGYERVHEKTKYTAELGYGWQLGKISRADRKTGSSLDRDVILTRDGTFVVDLLNGSYSVTLRLGDLGTSTHDAMGIFLEGIQVDTVTTAPRTVVPQTYPVTVSDEDQLLRRCS